MPRLYADGHTYEVTCDLIDVTSMSRPDTDWRYICGEGGMHSWFVDQAPARRYEGELRYTVPTLRWVKDGVGYFEDGEPYDIGHHECAQCGEHIEPRFTADTNTVYMRGIEHYTIDDVSVSKEEFTRRVKEATGRA